jgi:hypothetical protein
VVTVEAIEPEPETIEPESRGLRCIQTYRGEVWVNAEGEPV